MTVLQNVMEAPLTVLKRPRAEVEASARAYLDKVGIGDKADGWPAQLSGGQQQRAAIARAIANDPPLIIADEPTGNLDSQTTDAVMRLFADLTLEGKTVVMVTHERDLAHFFTRFVTLADGQIVAREIGVPV